MEVEVQEKTEGAAQEQPEPVTKAPRRAPRVRHAPPINEEATVEAPEGELESERERQTDALLKDVLPRQGPTPEEIERGVARVQALIGEKAEEMRQLDRLPAGIPTVQVHDHQIAQVNADVSEMLIALCEYDKQRPTSPSTVQRYTDLQLSGEFGLNLLWIGWVGAKPYIINGKHRLTACIEAEKKRPGVTFPCIIVETFHDNKHDIDLIYANQDRGKDRTAADYLRTVGEDSLGNLEQTEGNRLASAACFIMTGFQNSSPTSARPAMQDILFRVKLAAVFRQVAASYFDAIRDAKSDLKKALLRAPVVAVAVAIMEEQPDKGKSFFQRIARFDNLTAKSGEWWMATNILMPGKYTSRENLRLTRAIAHAWNAYYDDKLLPDFKLPKGSDERPIFLRGTSYTEKVVHIPAKLGEYRSALGTAPQPKRRRAYQRANKEETE